MVSIGIDVGGTNLRAGVVDRQGHLRFSVSEPTPTDKAESFLLAVEKLIHQIQEQTSEPLLGVGLGWPGTVDSSTGMALDTPNLSAFQNYSLVQELKKRISLPVYLENDAKCAGLAEKQFGAGQDFSDFILLTFGTGIGGAIFADSKLVRGRAGLAGEMGHFCLHPKGLACNCGGYGCFEQYCSARALEKRAQHTFKKDYSAKEILEHSHKQPEFRSLIQEYVQDLALALGSLINIFDPQAVIFSGGLFTSGGQAILEELHTQIAQQGLSSLKQEIRLLPSRLDGKAGILGAASLVFAPCFDG